MLRNHEKNKLNREYQNTGSEDLRILGKIKNPSNHDGNGTGRNIGVSAHCFSDIKGIFINVILLFIVVLFASSDSTGPSGGNKTNLATSGCTPLDS